MLLYRLMIIIALLAYAPLSHATEYTLQEDIKGTKRRMDEKDTNPRDSKIARTENGSSSHQKDPFQTLCDELKVLCKRNHKAHQEADTQALERNYARFQELARSQDWAPKHWTKAAEEPEEWVTAPYSFEVMKAPSQKTPYEVVGGHLFYPADTMRLLESPYTKELLKRRDYIRGFTIATRYHHPAAEYHLTYILKDLYDNHTESGEEEEYPLFFQTHFTHALAELEGCRPHPEACYILGSVYAFEAYKVQVYDNNPKKAFEVLMQANTPHNKLQALIVKRQSTRIFPEGASVEEFVELGKEESYGAAYAEAAHMTEDEEKKLKCLEKAIQLDFYPAYIDKGYMYEKRGDKNQALKEWGKAGEKGVTYGYILCAAIIAGHPCTIYSSITPQEISELSKKDKTRIVDYYTQAGKAHDPRGWYQLYGFYLNSLYGLSLQEEEEETSQVEEKKQELYKLTYNSLLEGINLGSIYLCERAKSSFPEKFSEIKEKYSPLITCNYYKVIEDFLK